MIAPGESLGTQERTIGGYAMMQGFKLDHVYVEREVVGAKPIYQRAAGRRAVAGRLAPGDTIITAKLDRMFRSALDALDVLAKLKDRGAPKTAS